jgi:putative MATE family efflux protein
MDQIHQLKDQKISTLIWRFSLPAMVGMIINALYNIVDRIYIGNAPELGANGLAALTIAFPIMLIVLAVGVLFGIGGATLFSIRLGQNKVVDAKEALGTSFFLIIVVGLFISGLGLLFLEDILLIFGASQVILPYAKDYMGIIFYGTTFQMIALAMNNFIRADGRPKMAMLTMLIGAGINIILDPIFIFGLDMGIAGAAYATIIAQAVSALWVASYFIHGKSNIKVTIKDIQPHPAIIMTIITLGLPGFSLQLAASVLNAFINRSLYMYGGDIAVSGMGIINSIQTFMILPIIGLNQGIQPIISYNFGAKQYDRVRETVKLGIMYATMIVSVGYVITRFFPGVLVGIFNREEALMSFGIMAIRSWFLLLPLVGFQIIASNFFQAIGRAKTAMFLTLTRQVIILLPAVLIFPQFFGLQGLLYAAPFADVFSSILTAIFFLLAMKHLDSYVLKEHPSSIPDALSEAST